MAASYTVVEKTFENYMNSLGKGTYIVRFPDTKEVNSLLWHTGICKKVILPRRPSDFLVTEKGHTYYAEIKSTANPKGLTSNLFSQQKGERTRILAAGGDYVYFIYNIQSMKWYKVPARELNENAKWVELTKFIVDIPKVNI